MDLWRTLRVGRYRPVHVTSADQMTCPPRLSGRTCRELAEPQKLLPHLLQPGLVALDPEIVAVYLQAATKVFGYWAAEQASTFDPDDLPRIRDAVDMALERAEAFATSPDIEVQERVRCAPTLFARTLTLTDIQIVSCFVLPPGRTNGCIARLRRW